MPASALRKVLYFVWFQTIWFLAILFTSEYLTIIGLLIAAFFILSPRKKTDLIMAAGIAVYGCIIDGALLWSGFFAFSDHEGWLIPIWLISLWIAFGLMLRVSLDYLQGRYALAAVLGAVSGPLSYYAGAQAGAVIFPADTVLTLGILSAIWAVTVPLCLYADAFLNGREGKTAAES
ncbi:DUF2878 domain-containing protein [Alteromonas sp. RKMC-009]|uniref:DUF2878 domain-containing protein n=1 Tax=Alteromonas sp. RKMC-009 TaxID=2267264 RepID=UPI000E6A60F9|nr:DUF2878 domain-containing protein [Alteromonas sp. RKMC-009]AYA64348.1 DUF2878 domain-containing protein [Alteromonas sp. RKMC-009]